jgi:pyruvate dehydrogenase E1 component
LWSATSYKTLREEAVVTERWNRLHPTETPRVPRVTQLLSQSSGPIVAVTDFVRSVPEQVGRYVGARTFTPLGTDGMGRSDTREALRDHFEVDMPHVVVTVLHELALSGQINKSVVADAIARYEIQTETLGALYA